ncbi:hypothetical protein F4604DRAFT_1927515 [Suillus subluteus]|nr:hypothetical protein F4604DRAFT_1927515 [Suillus subluteus]
MSRGTGCTRFNGLSKSVISHSFRGRHRQTHILMAGKQSQRVADADAMHWAEIQEMSTEDRDMVENMITDYGISEMLPHTAPPGEEGLEFSHAGGEHEAFEGLASQITEISGWIENQTTQWDIQVDLLVEAYLDYCSRSAENGMPIFNGPPVAPSSSDTQCVSLSNIELVDIFPAYDIYLEIIHCVDKHLQAALKHNTPNWRLLNSCPACFYKLQDEPTLEFDWLVSIDCNNSLKRWDSAIYGTTAHIDSRKARSDYWIGPTTVDQFKGKVKAREDSSPDDWENEPVDSNFGLAHLH